MYDFCMYIYVLIKLLQLLENKYMYNAVIYYHLIYLFKVELGIQSAWSGEVKTIANI